MAYNPGVLDTGIISRGVRESKLDLTTPINIYTGLQANKRANRAAAAQQKLSDLTLSQTEKKLKRQDQYRDIMQNSLNPNGTVNGVEAIQNLNRAGLFYEAEQIQNRMVKRHQVQQQKMLGKAKIQDKKQLELGKASDAVISSDDPLSAFMFFRKDAVKRGLPLSEGLLNYNPSDEEIENNSLNPKVATELKYLSERAIKPRGPMSLEDKLTEMDERYKRKKDLIREKSKVKVDQPLTEAEKSRERIAKRKVGIEEKKEERAAEKWELDRKTALQKHKKIKANFKSQINKFDRFINKARKVAESPDLIYTTGEGRFHPKRGKNIPFIDTKGKDLQADIDVLLGMQTLETMAELKRLSPTGSTGFGALSAPELKILQDAATSIGNDEVSAPKKKAIILEAISVIEKFQDNLETFESENDLLGPEKTDDDLLNDGIDEL